MEVKNIAIDKLIPYEFNNKKHDVTQIDRIANSIKEFGFTQPIVIDKDNFVIIGHGRLEASKKLGLDKVPCVQMDKLNATQIKKLRILDNKLNESERDMDNLRLELGGGDLDNFNIGDIELSVEDLFGDMLDPDELGDSFTLPSGDKSQFEQITFTLTTEQMEKVKEALEQAKAMPDMVQAEGMGNENKNANALFVIVMQWQAQTM